MKLEVKERYKDYLNTRQGVDFYNRFKKIMYGADDSLVVRLSESLVSKIDSKELNILDVGGGDGQRLKFIMKAFENKGIKCRATLVEPSFVFTEDLRDSLKSEDRDLEIDIVNSTFEKYVPSEKFDLILLIHSFYSFYDKSYLEKIKDCFKSGGLIAIVGNGTDSFLAGMKNITDGSYGSARRNVQSIIDELNEEGFSTELEPISTKFDDMLSDNSLAEDGKLVVSWIAMCDYVDVPVLVVKRMTDFFIENSKEGKIEEKEVFVFARREEDK